MFEKVLLPGFFVFSVLPNTSFGMNEMSFFAFLQNYREEEKQARRDSLKYTYQDFLYSKIFEKIFGMTVSRVNLSQCASLNQSKEIMKGRVDGLKKMFDYYASEVLLRKNQKEIEKIKRSFNSCIQASCRVANENGGYFEIFEQKNQSAEKEGFKTQLKCFFKLVDFLATSASNIDIESFFSFDNNTGQKVLNRMYFCNYVEKTTGMLTKVSNGIS